MRISDWSSDVCSSDLRSLVEIMMRQAAQNSLLRFSNSAQLLTSFGRFADRRLSAEQCQIADFRADSRWIGKPHLRTLGTIGAQPNLGVSFIHSARRDRTSTPLNSSQ